MGNFFIFYILYLILYYFHRKITNLHYAFSFVYFSDNYGFVTFAYKNDAYEAVEHGNDDPSLPRYDLCFGGRRAFCKVKYADLGTYNHITYYIKYLTKE